MKLCFPWWASVFLSRGPPGGPCAPLSFFSRVIVVLATRLLSARLHFLSQPLHPACSPLPTLTWCHKCASGSQLTNTQLSTLLASTINAPLTKWFLRSFDLHDLCVESSWKYILSLNEDVSLCVVDFFNYFWQNLNLLLAHKSELST